MIEIKDDTDNLFALADKVQGSLGEKFLTKIHPLIDRYYNISGNDFVLKIPNKVMIDYNGLHYWVMDGDIHNIHDSGLWFPKEGCDVYGRKFGNERDGWFNLVARLCCKYEVEIKLQIQELLKGLLK